MNKNAKQEKKKINFIKNRQNAKTVEALTHTHTQCVYKINENLKKISTTNKIENKKLNVVNNADTKKLNTTIRKINIKKLKIKSKARIFDARNFAKRSLLCVQKIGRNISLKFMELQPYDTS